MGSETQLPDRSYRDDNTPELEAWSSDRAHACEHEESLYSVLYLLGREADST
jgi:hypothetical protein